MKHFKRFLAALALAGLLSVSGKADANPFNWMYWCETNPYTDQTVCGWVWMGNDKRKGKGGRK